LPVSTARYVCSALEAVRHPGTPSSNVKTELRDGIAKQNDARRALGSQQQRLHRFDV
jgi:hypothetical protein